MQIRGVELAVTVTGNGKPFIWGHGLMGSMAVEDGIGLFNWSALLDIIKLIRYDARGHGQSEASYTSEDYQWANLADDIIGVADAIDADRFIAGGVSMGCATSLYAALTASERVAALVLGTPPTAWETRAAQAEIYNQMANIVESRGLSALAGLLTQQPLLPKFLSEELPELEEVFSRHIGTLNERVLPHVFRGAATSDLPAREKVRTLTIPALILAWAGDAGHPISTAEELCALLPNSQLHIASSIAETRAWPRLIRDFVANLP